MDSLTLYTNPMSRGRIARWMLEETGQPYTTVPLDYATSMKAPEFLAINPMGKVPALTHGRHVVTECAAICTYLAHTFPEAGLMPEERSDFYRWMFFGAGPLEAAAVNAALQVSVPAEKRGMVGYGSLDQVIAALAGRLAQVPYFCGHAFTAVDVYVGAQIGWGMRFGTLPSIPVFLDYWDRISQRPAALRAIAADDALMEPRP